MGEVRVKDLGTEILIILDNSNAEVYEKDKSKWSAEGKQMVFSLSTDDVFEEIFRRPTTDFSEPKESSVVDLLLLLTTQLLTEPISMDFRDYTVGIANPAWKEGRVFYDYLKGALSYFNDESDTTINIGQEIVIKVYNANGATIMNGQAVRFDGNVVDAVPTIVRSLADTTLNAMVGGVATHNISIGETGYITVLGQVSGLDTSMWNEGDVLFLSETVPGGLTNIEQSIVTRVAIVCISDSTEGCIIVSVRSVEDPFAIGQSFNDTNHLQALTTTPTPIEGYSDTPFEKNLTITATASGGSFRAIISPLSPAFSGFYEIQSNATVTSSSNVVVITELYVDGASTGLRGVIDFSNNSIDAGSAVTIMSNPGSSSEPNFRSAAVHVISPDFADELGPEE